MKLILNCPRALVITCLSHKGPNIVQRTTFKVLPWRKLVHRLSLYYLSAASSSTASSCTGKAYCNNKQNTATWFNSLKAIFVQTKLKQSNFIYLFCEACNGVKVLHRSMKDVNKYPANELYNNFLNPKLSFPL